jgi:hypothetical protein
MFKTPLQLQEAVVLSVREALELHAWNIDMLVAGWIPGICNEAVYR